ncbi:TetR/AcrR family transcriptional regulator [Paraburkholderia sp. BCC1884]|uniref:TetR/AcrR family transcriptional regulator n=1 Tax=Paraburkholderia sp. BCC1884 TaxID=2562668 RepID=UPI0011826F98|nr:TetR/AcrR family transcriptional regulator [Paraburkholderia sp. BCC1884]
MKKSKTETAETRRRIVETAARQFRRNGIQATGVAEVMAEAGLTHGGFYRHFGSKDQLVAEACEAGFGPVTEAFEAATKRDDGEGFNAIVDSYVSTGHRDNPEEGCPLAGMGSELARADLPTREIAAKGFDDMVGVIAKGLEPGQPESARSEAIFAVATMIGAITMARVIADPDASASVLEIVRERLKTL